MGKKTKRKTARKTSKKPQKAKILGRKSQFKGVTWSNKRQHWHGRVFYNGSVETICVDKSDKVVAEKLRAKVEELTQEGIKVSADYGKKKKKVKRSQYKGLSWNSPGKHWQASIWYNGQQHSVSNLGVSKSEEALAERVRKVVTGLRKKKVKVSHDYGKQKK